MSFLISILTSIPSIILGYFIHGWLDKHKKKIMVRREKVESEKKSSELFKKLNNVDYSNKYGQISIAHGVPILPIDSIKLSQSRDLSFYYPIPEGPEKQELSSIYKFRQGDNEFLYTERNNCLSNSFSKSLLTRIDKGMACFGTNWEDSKIELSEIAKEVTHNFLEDLHGNKVRFNGALFGVNYVDSNRIPGPEDPTVFLDFYSTDYFTFRVFAEYYLRHRQFFLDQSLQLHSNDLNGRLQHLSLPFLSSFGLTCLVIVSFHTAESPLQDDDIILLGKRSDGVVVDKNKIHFTMNEAFSLRDTIQDGVPDFVICLDRGLKEENGLIRDHIDGAEFGEYRFLGVGMDSNKCEMGASCYVKVVLNADVITIDEFIEDFLRRYRTAKDGRLETTGFIPVQLRSIDRFISDNENEMSKGLISTLEGLLDRYKLGMI